MVRGVLLKEWDKEKAQNYIDTLYMVIDLIEEPGMDLLKLREILKESIQREQVI